MRPIDADAVLVEVKKAFDFSDRRGQLAHAISCIQNAPTIEAEPVRHGRWIKKENYGGGIYTACSECGAMMNLPWFWYCGKCGAKMDASDDQRGGAENGKM